MHLNAPGFNGDMALQHELSLPYRWFPHFPVITPIAYIRFPKLSSDFSTGWNL